MDFKTTTAYDIGCAVYIPEFYEGYIVVGPCVITNIEINIGADKTKISYYINNNNGTFAGCFPEDRVFRTLDECEQWCKEHG